MSTQLKFDPCVLECIYYYFLFWTC